MFGHVILFAVAALILAYLGFFALAGLAGWVAKILFIVAILGIIIRAIGMAARGRPPV